jgi:hypothetical protein
MAGTFTQGARPVLPGEYTDFVAQSAPNIAPSPGGIVAVAGLHDWGPYDEATLCDSYDDFVAKFGSGDTELRRAVLQAFVGEGVSGKGGASAVLAVRMGLSSAIASAAHSLQNATPAAAIALTARYPGTLGNSLTLTVQAGAVGGTSQLLVLLGGAVVEKYTYTSTSISSLVAQINAVSAYVSASLTIDGVALANVSAAALSGGNDGTTYIAGDYTSALAALANQEFRVLAFANLSDPSIAASVQAWVDTQNTSGLRCELVLGGALGESVNTAETAASGLNDPFVVRIGVGTITDVGNITPGIPVDLSTAQFAPRVAGVIAARGEKADLIMARFAGVKLKSDAPQPSDQQQAPSFGLTVFSADGRQDAPVRIAQGCTTFTQPTGALDPRNPSLFNGTNVYGVVKYLMIMAGFESDLQALLEESDGNIGDLNVNDRTRDFLIGEGRKLAGQRASAGIIQANPTVVIDTSTFGPPSDDQDFVAIKYGFRFSPSLRQVFNSIAVAV